MVKKSYALKNSLFRLLFSPLSFLFLHFFITFVRL